MGELTDTSTYLNEWREQPATYNRRDLLTYALGIGCDEMQFVYEKDKNFAAFPTYPIVLTFKGDVQDVVNFPSKAMGRGARKPPFKGVKVMLDGERYIEMVKPLPKKGGDVLLRERLTGVFKKGKGATFETETQILSKSGDLYYRIYSSAFLVGAKDFTESGGPSLFSVVQAPSRSPDAVAEYTTARNQAMLYRLSGDYNPLHIATPFAKTSGFPEPILHGLASLGISVRLVLKTYANGDATRYRAVQVRFVKPVFPGQTLVVEMWKVSNTRIVFATKVKETGSVCVANAFVDLRDDGAPKL
eukprot:TRINITY_DN3222_c0_g1_i1.p2 TRINITY_DN3222_c0_g1~~TRINITY_DN3222_c0_g1_i1.p2  ORF type:complete len:323 (+),score=139.48 TRINITY_DN3222_c0_g1_i1:64-969(+)